MSNIKLFVKIKEDSPSPLCSKLIDYLLTTSFRSDPASYKYHHVYKHGLITHCYELYCELKKLVEENKKVIGEIPDEVLFLIAFGHDLEKIGTYKYNFTTNSYDYRFHKMNGLNHGEYGFDKLCKILGEEFNNHPNYELIKTCIYGHMGDYEKTNRGKQYYHDNVEKCPLLWLTHQADMKSCELNGTSYKELLEEVDE